MYFSVSAPYVGLSFGKELKTVTALRKTAEVSVEEIAKTVWRLTINTLPE
jgi:hypothetical protein